MAEDKTIEQPALSFLKECENFLLWVENPQTSSDQLEDFAKTGSLPSESSYDPVAEGVNFDYLSTGKFEIPFGEDPKVSTEKIKKFLSGIENVPLSEWTGGLTLRRVVEYIANTSDFHYSYCTLTKTFRLRQGDRTLDLPMGLVEDLSTIGLIKALRNFTALHPSLQQSDW